MFRAVLVVILVAASATRIAVAQTYEEALKVVAADLVTKLEAAKQHSGTVLDFTDLQGVPNELGRFLAQELSDQLVSAGKTISFVDRSNIQTLLRENKLSAEGFVSPETTKKIGNLIGIDTVIFGTTTLLGDKVRLSVRAVSVETGWIVATQSASLPAAGGLGEMYTHGVASNARDATATVAASSGRQPQANDIRTRFRADSIKMTARPVNVRQVTYPNLIIRASFTIENHSGIAFGIGAVNGSIILGSCRAYIYSGLKFFQDSDIEHIKSEPDPQNAFIYVPDNGSITASAEFWNCPIQQNTTVDLSISLIVAAGREVFVMPASTSVATR
jgi:hypothetical protein